MRHNAQLNSEIYNKISFIHSKTKYLDNIVELIFINKVQILLQKLYSETLGPFCNGVIPWSYYIPSILFLT